MDHLHETPESGGIHRRILVRAKEPLRVVPFLVHLNEPDAVVAQLVQFALVPIVRVPRLAARILAEVIDAMPRQIVGDEMLAQARAHAAFAECDVLQPPPMTRAS